MPIVRRDGTPIQLAWSLAEEGNVVFSLGDAGGSRALFAESLELARSLDDTFLIGLSLFGLAYVSFLDGDLDAIRVHLDESLEMTRLMYQPWGIAWAQFSVGVLSIVAGRHPIGRRAADREPGAAVGDPRRPWSRREHPAARHAGERERRPVVVGAPARRRRAAAGGERPHDPSVPAAPARRERRAAPGRAPAGGARPHLAARSHPAPREAGPRGAVPERSRSLRTAPDASGRRADTACARTNLASDALCVTRRRPPARRCGRA